MADNSEHERNKSTFRQYLLYPLVLALLLGGSAPWWLDELKSAMGKDGNEQVDPASKTVDIDGRWSSPVGGYVIHQTGASFTWQIGPDSGAGRVLGDSIIVNVHGRDVVYSISRMSDAGRPLELKTDDPQFARVVLSRPQ